METPEPQPDPTMAIVQAASRLDLHPVTTARHEVASLGILCATLSFFFVTRKLVQLIRAETIDTGLSFIGVDSTLVL